MAGCQALAVALLLLTVLAPPLITARSLAQARGLQQTSPSPPPSFALSPGFTAPGEDDGASAPSPETTPIVNVSASDVTTLNFALQLEYLMAEFYSCALTGNGLSADLRGGGPPSDGCIKANLTTATAILLELSDIETKHVAAIRRVLGAGAVPIPKLNIGSAFADAANLAFKTQANPAFSPYLDDNSFYLGAFMLEEPVGFTYYGGAIQAIRDRPNLVLVSKILGVEGAHSSVVRSELFRARDTPTPYNNNQTVQQVALAFANLRGQVGAGSGQGITANYSGVAGANVVADDANGLGFARNTGQVRRVIYLGAQGDRGGFYPEGLNPAASS